MGNQTIIYILSTSVPGAALASGRTQSQLIEQPHQHRSRREANTSCPKHSSPEDYQKLAAYFEQGGESLEVDDGGGHIVRLLKGLSIDIRRRTLVAISS